MLTNSIPVWFELPTLDLDRATGFYEKAFAITLTRETLGDMRIAVFPHVPPEPTGALVHGRGHLPVAKGCLLYFRLAAGVAVALERIRDAGGKVVQPSMPLPDGRGHFGHFLDSEGNRVGLYSTLA